MVYGSKLGDRKCAFLKEVGRSEGCRGGNATHNKPAVKADAGGVVCEVEIADELIHVWKELCGCDRFYDPKGTEGCKLSLWDGSGRGLCRALVVEERSGLVWVVGSHCDGKE